MKHLAKHLSRKETFGPLWIGEAQQSYVLECLRKYMRDEEHSKLFGKTVEQVAKIFIEDAHAASGEELDALACLLIHGKGGEVI